MENTQALLEEKRTKLQELREMRAALARKKAMSSTASDADDSTGTDQKSVSYVESLSGMGRSVSMSAIKSPGLSLSSKVTVLQHSPTNPNDRLSPSITSPKSSVVIQSSGKITNLVISEPINLFDIAPTSNSERLFFSKGVEANIGIDDKSTESTTADSEGAIVSEGSGEATINTQTSEKDVNGFSSTESNLITPLSEMEIQSIESTLEYHSFLEQSTKYVERILNQKYDPLVDYTLSKVKRKDKEVLSFENTFIEEFTKDRAVTSLDWSLLKSELFLASYAGKSDKDSVGGILIWSIYLPERPEFHLESPYSITKAVFHPYKANIVIGASAAGHILLWDISVSKYPLQQSPIDPEYHTYPICGLKVVGTSHSPIFTSICTDGVVCMWKLNQFKKPTKRFYLSNRGDNSPISPFCFTLSPLETSKFYVGRESGSIYSSETYERSKDIKEFVGHFGPVLGLDCHNQFAFKDLLLSCGVDWSVRLWNTKTGKMISVFSEYGDPVYSVKWSPTHPAVFATVDGGGYLKLWNLNVDKSSPIYSKIIDDFERKYSADASKRTLTDLCFSPDGSTIVVGSIHGHIHQLQLEEGLWNVKSDDDWSSFSQWLSKNVA